MSIAVELLKDDRNTITYRPRFATFFDSATAAILFQQILYWWGKSKDEVFFKYRDACNAPDYKKGDSWCEELGFTVREFDAALKIIGTKVKRGESKAKALEVTTLPELNYVETIETQLKHFESTIQHLVIYWTDSNRKTHYTVNPHLLGNCVTRIYLDECASRRYLKNAYRAFSRKSTDTQLPSFTETTQETTRIKDSAPVPDAVAEIPNPSTSLDEPKEPEPKPAIPEKEIDTPKLDKVARDAWYDAVLEVFGESAGLNGKYQKLLRGEFTSKKDGEWFEYQMPADSGLTPDLLREWGSQYRRDNPDLTIKKEPIKVQSALITFLEAQKPAIEIVYYAEPLPAIQRIYMPPKKDAG